LFYPKDAHYTISEITLKGELFMDVRKLMEELALVEVNTNDVRKEEGAMQILEWVAYSATETIGQVDFKLLNSTMFNEALE
jgi:hypothetical protein